MAGAALSSAPTRRRSRRSRRRGRADLLTPDISGFDASLGRTYAELGLEARSMHKCQGTSQLLLLPGQSQNRTYRLQDSLIDQQRQRRADGRCSTGIDVDTSIGAGAVRRVASRGAFATRRIASAVEPLAARRAGRRDQRASRRHVPLARRGRAARRRPDGSSRRRPPAAARPSGLGDPTPRFEIDCASRRRSGSSRTRSLVAAACGSTRWPTTASSRRDRR